MAQKKAIIVINGKGGIGKDSLIDAFAQDTSKRFVFNVSSIQPIKDMCEPLKPDKKDLAYRHLLSDVKYSVDAFYEQTHGISYTHQYLLNAMKLWETQCEQYKDHDCFMFVHIREPENISAFLKEAEKELHLRKDKDTKLTSLLVTSNRSLKSYGNSSDDGVEDYDYDMVFESNGTKEDDAKSFIKHIYTELTTIGLQKTVAKAFKDAGKEF